MASRDGGVGRLGWRRGVSGNLCPWGSPLARLAGVPRAFSRWSLVLGRGGWRAPPADTHRMYSTECVEQAARVLTGSQGELGRRGGVGLLQEELVLCRVWAPGRGLPEKESRNVSGVAGATHGMLGGGRVSHPCEG